MELLKQLQAFPVLKETRLVGGTALALQYGHRMSVDLDLFGHIQSTPDQIIDTLRCVGEIEILNKTSHIIQMVINGIKVDVVNYEWYDWIDDPVCEDGVVLASPKDIAALKVNAIVGRGTKKDFIDLFVLLQHYTMTEIMTYYKQKYPDYSEYRAVLSMTYFADAEQQSMPKMFIEDTWETIKKYIINEIKTYTK
ncbi:MAG: nucleotidyl transferase AbiEii/AbiGii toxin family protein [Paludibacteraceae bacterium]